MQWVSVPCMAMFESSSAPCWQHSRTGPRGNEFFKKRKKKLNNLSFLSLLTKAILGLLLRLLWWIGCFRFGETAIGNRIRYTEENYKKITKETQAVELPQAATKKTQQSSRTENQPRSQHPRSSSRRLPKQCSLLFLSFLNFSSLSLLADAQNGSRK